MHAVLAVSWLDPFVAALWWVVQHIDLVVRNLGLSFVILALLIRLAFWSLNVKQFKSMLDMQRVAPKLKALQQRYKGEPQRLQQEQMALYREAGVNPLAGCLPLLIQLPFLYSVYWVVVLNTTLKGPKGVPLQMCQSQAPQWFSSFPLHDQLHALCFNNEHFLWIGSTLSAKLPHVFASNLGTPDVLMLLLYVVSMYFSMRYGSVPSTDPQQAQTQRIMALISPLMFAYIGWRASWPSAMILYWLSYNAFTMAQQLYMLRRYHQPLSMLDSEHVVGEEGASQQKSIGLAPAQNADPANESARKRRRRRKKRK